MTGINIFRNCMNVESVIFVVGELPADMKSFQDANFLQLANPLKGLQKLAEKHREQFQIPVIGITGSNGKTIVKEWLYHC